MIIYWQVIQFGVDCDHDECTCRDPEAEENKNKDKATDPGQLWVMGNDLLSMDCSNETNRTHRWAIQMHSAMFSSQTGMEIMFQPKAVYQLAGASEVHIKLY